jgi:hypothetical protein
MSYLDNRVKNFKEFEKILADERTKQCGDRFVLFVDGKEIIPDLNLLGAGSYGVALSIENPELKAKGINVVVKAADGRIPTNKREIFFNLFFSSIVERGLIPNFPLFSKCKPNINVINDDDNEDNKQISNCDCGPRLGVSPDTTGGCDFIFRNANHASQTNQKLAQNILNFRNGCMVSFSEKYDMDASHFILNFDDKKDYQNQHFLCTIIIQFIFALKAMHDNGASHSDTHLKNIFLKMLEDSEIEKRGTIDYRINNKTYKIRHYGILAVLADFGLTDKTSTDKDKGFLCQEKGGITGITNKFIYDMLNGCGHAAREGVTYFIQQNAHKFKKPINPPSTVKSSTETSTTLKSSIDLLPKPSKATKHENNVSLDFSFWKKSSFYDFLRFLLDCSYTYDSVLRSPDITVQSREKAYVCNTAIACLVSDFFAIYNYLTPQEQVEYDPINFLDDIETNINNIIDILKTSIASNNAITDEEQIKKQDLIKKKDALEYFRQAWKKTMKIELDTDT